MVLTLILFILVLIQYEMATNRIRESFNRL